MFIVKWKQWYRCGQYGDDKDFSFESQEFNSKQDAEQFIEALVAGKYRGMYDSSVKRDEVELIESLIEQEYSGMSYDALQDVEDSLSYYTEQPK